MKKLLILISLLSFNSAFAQDINTLVKNVRAKLNAINDYEATGRMKTNVAYLKIPVSGVKVFFKKPNKLKVKSEKGISFIPKGAVSINMGGIFTDNEFTIIDAGSEKIGNILVRV